MLHKPLSSTLALSAVLIGCDADQGVSALERACDDATAGADADLPALARAGITLAITSGLTANTAAADLTIRGTTAHSLGFAIQRIRVGGVDATSDAFNFGQWNAVIKLDALRAAQRDEQGRVRLDIRVGDSCGEYEGAPLFVAMDVTTLSLATAYPGDADHIPADGATAALVTIAADKGAVGSQVRVSALPSEGVALQGLSGDLATFVAVGDRAEAQFRVTSTREQTITLQARSTSTLASATATAVGRPRFVPESLVLAPGELSNVAVLSAGSLRECWATSDIPGLHVTLAGHDLLASPGSAPGDGKSWVLTLAADAKIAADGAGTVVCRDRFLQETTLVVAVDA